MAQQAKQGLYRRSLSLFKSLHIKRSRAAVLVALAVGLAMLEGIGAGLLNPVLQYIQFGPEASQDGLFGRLMSETLALLGLPMTLLAMLIVAFIPILLRQGLFLAYAYLTARVQQGAATRLREDGFSALASGDLSFIVGEGFGTLVSTLTAQVQRGCQAVLVSLQQVSTGLVIVMYVLVLLALDWRLALMAVTAIGIISYLVKGAVKRSRALGAETMRRNNETYSVIGERISAIRLVKMLGQEKAEKKKVSVVVRHLAEAQVRIAFFSGVIEVTIDPLLMFTVFAIVYTGVEYADASLATLGLFMFILLRLNQKAKDFNSQRQSLSALIDSLITVIDVITRAKASRHIRSGNVPFPGVHEGIRFEDVSFAYTDEAEALVLKGVSLEFPSRSQTAIVGRSGAGKSTLVDLIPRLREATAGRILFDGTPIQEFELRSLRRSIGFMTQDALMFDDTIYNNLAYGLDREPTADEVETALTAGYCMQFIETLPQGLETRVGERGVRLSGGQRQRLALARVFLQDPDILILDEPTSALDSESEEYIQRALESIRHHKTLIVIAHRLSTVQHSDQIVVLDHGRIIEQGGHDDLLAQAGAYHRLFDLQLYQ